MSFNIPRRHLVLRPCLSIYRQYHPSNRERAHNTKSYSYWAIIYKSSLHAFSWKIHWKFTHRSLFCSWPCPLLLPQMDCWIRTKLHYVVNFNYTFVPFLLDSLHPSDSQVLFKGSTNNDNEGKGLWKSMIYKCKSFREEQYRAPCPHCPVASDATGRFLFCLTLIWVRK